MAGQPDHTLPTSGPSDHADGRGRATAISERDGIDFGKTFGVLYAMQGVHALHPQGGCAQIATIIECPSASSMSRRRSSFANTSRLWTAAFNVSRGRRSMGWLRVWDRRR